jgi:hypothetical protein
MAARARWSALFAAATLLSRSDAVSTAGQPRTSRAIRAARCLGGVRESSDEKLETGSWFRVGSLISAVAQRGVSR